MRRLLIGLLALLSLGVSAIAQQRKDLPRPTNTSPPDQPQATMPLHMTVEPVGQCWTYKGGNTVFYGEIPAGKYVFVRLRTMARIIYAGSTEVETVFYPMDQDISFTPTDGGDLKPRSVLGGGSGTKFVPDGVALYRGDRLAWESDWGWHAYLVREPVSFTLAYDQFPEHHDYGVAEFCLRDVPSLHGTVVPNTAWSRMGWVVEGRRLL